MKLLALHSDFIEFEAKKKAIKDPEEIKEKKQRIEPALVVFMSIEKRDEADPKGVAKRTIKEIKGIFNVAHGRSIEIEVLIKKILSILKLKKEIISKVNKKKKIEIDISKIKKKTGWKPKKKIEEGLNEIFKKDMHFYRK